MRSVPSIFKALGLSSTLITLGVMNVACEDKDAGDSAAGYLDNDGDGWPASLDCNDNTAAINPGAEEIPYNGIDDDCSEATPDDDVDGDGYLYADDCDDRDDDNYPDAPEACDEEDNDCDGDVDESPTGRWYADEDDDGYGDEDVWGTSCEEGWVTEGGDCDDEEYEVNPGRPEVCDDDNIDEDCDGVSDDNDPDADGLGTWYPDADGDSYGDEDASGVLRCDPNVDYNADNNGDCDDDDRNVNPDAGEVCDADDTDEDCNGLADDDDSYTDTATMNRYYPDADGDEYGDEDDAGQLRCDGTPAYPERSNSDCDDANPNINPGAREVCDNGNVDEDCDGKINGDDEVLWYADEDGDGYGDPRNTEDTCDPSAGYTSDNTDCDDTNVLVNPGAAEVWYDGIDGNCDESSDYDADGDGYDHDGYGGLDCDDTSILVNPAAPETWYDGVDSDCDGASDYDADGDGYDSDAFFAGDDCDDTDSSIHPGALEDDPAVDQDCDGQTELAPVAVASYNTALSSLQTCEALYLDGSSSYDPEGAPIIAWDWTVESVPGASGLTTAKLASASDEQPLAYPDVAGTYTFGLVVTDADSAASEMDTLTLTITSAAGGGGNLPPLADAGADQSTSATSTCVGSGYSAKCPDCADATFVLDASGSADPDGSVLNYEWTITSGEADAELADETSASPTLTVYALAAEYGSTESVDITLQLEVTDCAGATDTDTVTVTYSCEGI